MEQLPISIPELRACLLIKGLDYSITGDLKNVFPNLISKTIILDSDASYFEMVGSDLQPDRASRCLAIKSFKMAKSLCSKNQQPLGITCLKGSTYCYLSLQSETFTISKIIDVKSASLFSSLLISTLLEITCPGGSAYGSTTRLKTLCSNQLGAQLKPLLRGEATKIFPYQKDPVPEAIFPGSWNPLSKEHMYMCTIAEAFCDSTVYFECSLENVNHPPLDFITAETIIQQFEKMHLVVTNAPTFIEKAKLFPGTTFVVGIDTWLKIIDPNYYQMPLSELLRQFKQFDVDFLVFGRKQGKEFITLTKEISYGLATKVPQHLFCDNPDDDYGPEDQLKQDLQKASYVKRFAGRKDKKKPITGL